MLELPQPERPAFSDAADWRALEHRLGSPEEATSLSASMFAAAVDKIKTGAQLHKFVGDYQTQILTTHEFPAILRAYHHARQNQAREIIELDRALKDTFTNEALANASMRVGRHQLRRLSALKTERVVARYWDAVHAKRASGWHTVVFGVVLAMYSIPLRQGLNRFGGQVIRGFLDAGALALRLREADVDAMEAALTEKTPALVERALADLSPGDLRCI